MADYGQTQRSTAIDDLAVRWPGKIGLTALVAAAYYVAARLSLGLILEPDGVAVFWPAAGISAGVLIALGPHARWPVAVGVMAATIPANLMGDRNLAASIAFSLCNAAEPLIIAGLIQRDFGPTLHLGRLRDVLGLLAAAVVGTVISGVGGAVSYRLFHSPDVPMLTSWWHWFASDVVGIIAVAPLFIGIATSIRRPTIRGEIPEAIAALGALAAMTLLVIAMPQRAWETVVPGALLVPFLLWLAARFRSVFSAFGGFVVSLTVVLTTIYGVGHFGAHGLPVEDRILQAQAFIVVVMLGALIIAALFAERRRAEAGLVRSNVALEQQRDNKLMNAEAVTAAIAHEIRQPLSAIIFNGAAGLKVLEKRPPDYQQVREFLGRIIAGAHRTSEVFEGIRDLFRRVDEAPQPTDVNEIVLRVLSSVLGELQDRGVAQRIHLAPELPLVPANRNQLHEVILNLVQNALDAMEGVPYRRVLRVTTELHGPDAILVRVEDSGSGIDAEKLDKIFDAFFTTKKRGMGLGLAICRMIIERHGGRLTASSDGKRGAVFTIQLPIIPPAQAPTRGDEGSSHSRG
jgi:signal transduction histidine kinase